MSLHFSAIKGKNILLITGYELVIPRSLAAGISPLLPFQGEGWDGGGVSAAKHKLSLVNRGQTELTPLILHVSLRSSPASFFFGQQLKLLSQIRGPL